MSSSHVQVLDRSLDIIEQLAVSENGMSIAELSANTGLPKSTVHRILSNFTERHYVEKDSETAIYSIGHKFVEVASLYLNKLQLKTEAAPIMHEIAVFFNAISYLGILENNEVIYLEKAEKLSSLRFYTQIGKHEPVHCTGLGKVLLAALPEDQCLQIVRSLNFRKYTPNTITSPGVFLHELDFVRRSGYAADHGEHFADNSCLAVPIRDYTGSVIAALSVSGHGMLETYGENYVQEKMREFGKELSLRMGFVEHDE